MKLLKWLRCHFWLCPMWGSSLLSRNKDGLIVGRRYFCLEHGTNYLSKYDHPLTREEYDHLKRNHKIL